MSGRLDQRRSLFRRLAKLLNGASLTGNERISSYFLWANTAQINSLMSEDVRGQLDAESTMEPLVEFLSHLPGTANPLDRMLALEQRFFLPDHNLIYTDKMSMAAGVEVRVPFLDLDLVELSARIPINLKQRQSEGKWVLKKALEPYLPRDVIYRPKTGFGAPGRRWMRQELRQLVGDLLSVESIRKRRIFDSDAVQTLITRNDNGQVDGTYILLSLMGIEIWCRSFLDRN